MESIKELEYLDKILLYLRDYAFNTESKIEDIYKHITGNEYDHSVPKNSLKYNIDLNTEPVTVKSLGTYYYHQRKLLDALRYLIHEEKLIYSLDGLHVSLTFKGLVKCDFGFVYEYRKEEKDRVMTHDNQKASTLLSKKQKSWFNWSVGIAIGGFLLSIVTLTIQLYNKVQLENRLLQQTHKGKTKQVHSSGTKVRSTSPASSR
jgi:hypothetical protein